MLEQMLAGAIESFRVLGVTLIGGHSSEGAELALGFSVTGFGAEERLFRKNQLKIGNKLVLTKPLGTGALFAARMRGRCHSRWFERMTDELLLPNHRAQEIFEGAGVVAGTDITGFGLAGHLLEMLDASGVSARLMFTEVKLYDGFRDVVSQGIVSTLHQDNGRFASRVSGVGPPEWLFDPQTCGGLLCAVKPELAQKVVRELHEAGYRNAGVVAEVIPKGDTPTVYL